MKNIHINTQVLQQIADKVNDWLPRFGVQFGIYENGKFCPQKEPFDPIPRVIDADTWKKLETGVKQRAQALNQFLHDIYHDKQIVKEGVIPEQLITSSGGYMAACENITPPARIYAHIAGIDLIEGTDGRWYVMQDNLRIPGSVVYPIVARKMWQKHHPELLRQHHVADSLGYHHLLGRVIEEMNDNQGLNVVLTTGMANRAYYEHKYLADKTGATLAYPGDMYVQKGKVYYGGDYNQRQRVGCIYRRVTAEDIDPVLLKEASTVGISNVFEAYKNQTVTFINALGNGVGDDKAIYYFVPQMIRFYLNEEPLLTNVPSYIPYYDNDRQYMLDNIHKLIIKNVKDRGHFDVYDGQLLSNVRLDMLRRQIASEPRKWIANEMIQIQPLPCLEEGKEVQHLASLRMYVLTSPTGTHVWKGGLTRFSRLTETHVVETHKGCGFKDTWILEE